MRYNVGPSLRCVGNVLHLGHTDKTTPLGFSSCIGNSTHNVESIKLITESQLSPPVDALCRMCLRLVPNFESPKGTFLPDFKFRDVTRINQNVQNAINQGFPSPPRDLIRLLISLGQKTLPLPFFLSCFSVRGKVKLVGISIISILEILLNVSVQKNLPGVVFKTQIQSSPLQVFILLRPSESEMELEVCLQVNS